MNTDAQTRAFNELRRKVIDVGGPMIRDYQVRYVLDQHGYNATPEQIDAVLFGDDNA